MADDHYRMVSRSARPTRTAVLMLAGRDWEGTAAGVLGSLSLTWGGARDIVVPVTAGGPHPAFRPVIRAFDPDWVTAYQTTSADLPEAGDGGFWVREVPDADVATMAGWCSPYPGRSGFYPWASRGQAIHSPLVPMAAFPEAWQREVLDLDLSQVDPLLALMVAMRTGTLNDVGDLPGGGRPRLLTALGQDVPALSEVALTGRAERRPSPVSSQVRHMRGLHAGPGVPLTQGISPVQPLERTRHGLQRLRPVLGRPAPWVVVVGDTCADFCFALACDRLLGGAAWLPLPRLPDAVLDAAFPALAQHITAISLSNGDAGAGHLTVPGPRGGRAGRDQLRGRGGEAFTDARTVVVASDSLSFDHPARLGDPDHLALAVTSAVHRDPADGSLRVDSALLTPIPGVARAAADGEVTWEVDVRVEGEQPPARHRARAR